MRVIIAGGRDIHDRETVAQAIIDAKFDITEVVCGCASGVDALGASWARTHGVPVREFRASWKQHGKAAGPMRNRLMAENADALILVWDGKSKGSRSMFDEAQKRSLQIYQHFVTA